MVVAMMLPASLPAFGVFADGSAARNGSRRAWPAFLGGYLAIWCVFGAVAFMGDLVLHRTVDASPWLTANAWLISASLLASGRRLSVRTHGSDAAWPPAVTRAWLRCRRGPGRAPHGWVSDTRSTASAARGGADAA